MDGFKATVLTIGGLVSAIVGATIGVEARYAKAADVAQAKTELKQELAIQRAYTDAGFLRQRKSLLEDTVFTWEAKKEERKLTEWEMKMFLRSKSELEDVKRELRTKPR